MIKEKINSNKGITLVSLVVTIVIMLILTTISISVPYNRFKVNNMNKMLNDLELLRDEVSNYYFSYSSLPLLRDAENNPIIYSYKELEFVPNPNDDEKYYIIDLQAMEGISLNYGLKGFNNPNTSDDVYIINERTHNIYYPRGIEVEGEKYYYIADKNEAGDVIHYSKPEIKMISGEKNSEGVYTTEVSIEFMPGKDTTSGAEKTTYSINGSEEKEISTLTNNILTIFEDGIYSIKVKNYDKDNNILGHTTININIQNKERKNRFITNWNVTLGETEGSQTYSTVVLPVYKNSSYDATIYWGDGTRTLLQHKTNGVTLTDAELIEKVTHNYTLKENDDALRTIEIEGTYGEFRMSVSTSTPTKLKLTNIEQWGSIGLTSINFKDCTNLGGIVPKPNREDSFEKCTSFQTCFQNTGIQSLEEGFSLPEKYGGSYFMNSMFSGCKNLESIPESFKIPPKATSTSGLFSGCSNLESLPESFNVHSGVTNMGSMFHNCTSLKKIPEDFYIPSGVTNPGGIVKGCTSLEELPVGFILPENYSGHLQNFFEGCESLKSLPDGFTIPEGATNLYMMFRGCSSLESLPDSFSIPESYSAGMSHMFYGCTSLETIPDNFTIPAGVTSITFLFGSCYKLKGNITIKGNPETYKQCFEQTARDSGGTLTVNYSKNCTNIDAILATGNANYVVKGSQID